MNTLRTVILTASPGIQIREKDLKRLRSMLKSIKTNFARIFHNKIIRFVLTKAQPIHLVRSACMLFVSVESCGCEIDCAWSFIVTKLSNMGERGSLRHVTVVPQEMTGLEFKEFKCRCISALGVFYRDQLNGVKFRRRYNLRPLPVRTYTA